MFWLSWILVIVGPILVFVVRKLFAKKTRVRSIVIFTSFLFVSLLLVSAFYNLYFTSALANEILFILAYLGVVTVLGISFRFKTVLLKILMQIVLIPTVLLLFLSGATATWGILYNEIYKKGFDHDITYEISNDRMLKIKKLGSALESDGLRLDVYKRYEFIPVIKKIDTYEDYEFYGDIEWLEFGAENDTITLKHRNKAGDIKYNEKFIVCETGEIIPL